MSTGKGGGLPVKQNEVVTYEEQKIHLLKSISEQLGQQTKELQQHTRLMDEMRIRLTELIEKVNQVGKLQ